MEELKKIILYDMPKRMNKEQLIKYNKLLLKLKSI